LPLQRLLWSWLSSLLGSCKWSYQLGRGWISWSSWFELINESESFKEVNRVLIPQALEDEILWSEGEHKKKYLFLEGGIISW
jgi:hypothetical protein